MFDLYAVYAGGFTVKYPRMNTMEECVQMAHLRAKYSVPMLLRAFKVDENGAVLFACAWKIRDGQVEDHTDVCIPKDFW
jgi:hypothetical protein